MYSARARKPSFLNVAVGPEQIVRRRVEDEKITLPQVGIVLQVLLELAGPDEVGGQLRFDDDLQHAPSDENVKKTATAAYLLKDKPALMKETKQGISDCVPSRLLPRRSLVVYVPRHIAPDEVLQLQHEGLNFCAHLVCEVIRERSDRRDYRRRKELLFDTTSPVTAGQPDFCRECLRG